MLCQTPASSCPAAVAGTVTPSEVAENVLRCIADSEVVQPPMRFFAVVDEADVRRQAAESTNRHASHAPHDSLMCLNEPKAACAWALPQDLPCSEVHIVQAVRKGAEASLGLCELRSSTLEAGTCAGTAGSKGLHACRVEG